MEQELPHECVVHFIGAFGGVFNPGVDPNVGQCPGFSPSFRDVREEPDGSKVNRHEINVADGCWSLGFGAGEGRYLGDTSSAREVNVLFAVVRCYVWVEEVGVAFFNEEVRPYGVTYRGVGAVLVGVRGRRGMLGSI